MSSARTAKPALALVASTTPAAPHTPADVIRRALATDGRFVSYGSAINGVAYDPISGTRVVLEGVDLGNKVSLIAATIAGSTTPIFIDKVLTRAADRTALNKRVLAYLDAQEELAA